MLIAHADKNSETGAPPDPWLIAAIGKLTEDLRRSGILVGNGGLAPTSTGARVQLAGGKVLDGPFTEAKEIIGGYAIVDVSSKQEAIELAKRFYQIHAEILGPSYQATGEVRQMFDGPGCE
jgi:hypothetical protein